MLNKSRPLADRVFVRPDKPESKTASGIIIPEQAKEKPLTGEVVAVGKTTEHGLLVGDRVIYSKFAGLAINVGDEEVLVMREADIFAVL